MKHKLTFDMWDENLQAIINEFPDDWAQNKSMLINSMIDYCIHNGFKVPKPLLRDMQERIKHLEEDMKILKTFCRIELGGATE